MAQTDVLVVGAGPTGLTLALDLARRDVAVRIIDQALEFPGGSRGKGLSPRRLEVLDDLAVIDRVLACGVTRMPHRKYRGAEVIAEIDPGAGQVPTPDIPYPAGLMIPQWRVEQILRDRLADFGVTVELGIGLRGLTQHADYVTAIAGEAEVSARYLVGCDGGRSTVRKALGLSLRGETPDVQLMAVGDVEVDGLSRDAWHQWFAGDGAIMLCPLPGTSAFQVQASHELDQDGSPLEPTLERFQQTFDRIAGLPGVRLRSLAWRSSYRVNVRMVDQLQAARVFLAGDAAHVHPIAGDRAPDAPLRETVTGSPIRLFDLFRGPHFTLLGLGERSAAALRKVETGIARPYLVGPGGFLDDGGHAARAYGADALILVRPDGYIGLIAGPEETEAVTGYLSSL